MSTPKKPSIKRRPKASDSRPAADMHKAFPAPATEEMKRTSVDLPAELYERVRVTAFKERIPMRQLYIEALEARCPEE